MKQKRFLVEGEDGVYHVYNRTAYARYTLDEEEREQFVRMLRRQAGFAGVEVLAYDVLSNHYHLLVRVPKAPKELSDAELLERYGNLYRDDPEPRCALRPKDLAAVLEKDDERAARVRKGLRARMNHLPSFMKELQQRFGIWYNQTRGNQGTLWSERFRSVLVEQSPAVMRVVAAYIELNSVRAGLVERPEEWRWCSLSAAVRGEGSARAGIRAITGYDGYEEALGIYRLHIYGVGGQAREPGGAAIPEEDVDEVVSRGGQLGMAELLRHRIRGFTRGAVLGTSRFLREFGRAHATHFGPKRKRFANRLEEGELEGIRSLRRVGGQEKNTGSRNPEIG